jgi:hypothetical protein
MWRSEREALAGHAFLERLPPGVHCKSRPDAVRPSRAAWVSSNPDSAAGATQAAAMSPNTSRAGITRFAQGWFEIDRSGTRIVLLQAGADL